jgi:hypothetical protein
MKFALDYLDCTGCLKSVVGMTEKQNFGSLQRNI